MEYLDRHVDLRVEPARVLDGARSALIVADLYAVRGDNTDAPLARGHGRIARYARGRDYHTVIKKRLHALCDELRALAPDAEFRAFTDTAPVLERELAQRAGLGWIGKHTLVIEPELGSYLLLGGVFTTLQLEPCAEPVTDHCGTCTRCIDACPTEAITPYSVDASRCISYLTIERREPIDPEFFEPIGDWLFGCDVCQEVCPHNAPTPRSHDAHESIHEAYEPFETGGRARDSFDLLEVLGWAEADRRTAFTTSALKRATLDMMKRNALIVAGNQLSSNDRLRARIEEIATDDAEAPMVRDTARQVLDT